MTLPPAPMACRRHTLVARISKNAQKVPALRRLGKTPREAYKGILFRGKRQTRSLITRILVIGRTRPLIMLGKSPNTEVQFAMGRVIRMVCHFSRTFYRTWPVMRKTRRVRGLIRFEVPSYLDGIVEVIDVWGSLCQATAPPTIVARPSGKKVRPPLLVSRRVAKSRTPGSLDTDARKIGFDFRKALESRQRSPLKEFSQEG
jgi:hypothetical protein